MEQDQVFERVSSRFWHATGVANVLWKPIRFGKNVKLGNKVQFGNKECLSMDGVTGYAWSYIK